MWTYLFARLIHSVEKTAANVHDLTPAAELQFSDEELVYADAGHQGIDKRAKMDGKATIFRTSMRSVEGKLLPKTSEDCVSS